MESQLHGTLFYIPHSLLSPSDSETLTQLCLGRVLETKSFSPRHSVRRIVKVEPQLWVIWQASPDSQY